MGCPKGPKDTGDFFDTAIQQKVRVIVSLNDDGEANSRYHNFWENERLCTLVLRDGWTIQKVSERILDQKPSEIPGGRDPRIVESTLIATKGDEKREITHFHYAGWHDKSPMPSEELLSTLYDRIEEINKKEGITPQTPLSPTAKAA